jgi:CHAD domain-containing protein
MPDAVEPAVLVLGAALRRTVAELDGFEAGILAGADDALHQARTRVRALRSTLSVYRGAFDADASRALRDSLASYGGLLGEAHDAEVRLLALRELREAVADQKTRAALAELVASAEVTAARGLEHVVTGIDSLEHALLLDRLRRFAAEPPAGPQGVADVVPFAHAALTEAVARMSRAARRARPDRLDDLHAVRKAARRVRYAAEAVAEATEASALAEAAEQLQDALGDHRDGVLLARELRGWAQGRDAAQRESLRALARDVERAAHASLAMLPQLLSEVRAAADTLG